MFKEELIRELNCLGKNPEVVNGRLFIGNRKERVYFINLKENKNEYSCDIVCKSLVGGKMKEIYRNNFYTDKMSLYAALRSMFRNLKAMGCYGADMPGNEAIDRVTLIKELERIAQKHLYIDTLETRSSDELDFHEVSVWGIASALEEAYKLGRNSK